MYLEAFVHIHVKRLGYDHVCQAENTTILLVARQYLSAG